MSVMERIRDLFARLARQVSFFFKETDYVALVYFDTLRDNFSGFVPRDPVKFEALRGEFLAMDADKSKAPWLAELFRIEIALIELMPDEAILARFWSIDDRFRRVVPATIVDRYDRWAPGKGDPQWIGADFVRHQGRTLLDVIHANYLINIGREKSVKRLQWIIALAAIAMGTAAVTFGASKPDGLKTGLLLIAGAGILGALLSIINRLQAVTATDAMTSDGVYELTGLRVGWVGILMSFAMGGGFALVLYVVVLAGLLQVASPTTAQAEAPLPAPSASPTPSDTGDPDATTGPAASDGPTGPGPAPDPSAATRGGDAPAATATPTAAPTGTPVDDQAIPDLCEDLPRGDLCLPWAHSVAKALGFANGAAFFKMLVLAFLAGFAERFVPDILNRLRKQVQ